MRMMPIGMTSVMAVDSVFFFDDDVDGAEAAFAGAAAAGLDLPASEVGFAESPPSSA